MHGTAVVARMFRESARRLKVGELTLNVAQLGAGPPSASTLWWTLSM